MKVKLDMEKPIIDSKVLATPVEEGDGSISYWFTIVWDPDDENHMDVIRNIRSLFEKGKNHLTPSEFLKHKTLNTFVFNNPGVNVNLSTKFVSEEMDYISFTTPERGSSYVDVDSSKYLSVNFLEKDPRNDV